MKTYFLMTTATLACTASAHAAEVDWSGVYAGLTAGYASVDDNLTGTPTPVYVSTTSSPNGFAGGAQVGVNFQQDSLVFGFESDFTLGDFGSNPDIITGGKGFNRSHAQHDWFATSRVRVGAAHGRTLAYVTGGAALLDMDLGLTGGGLPLVTSHHTLWGAAVGIGVEQQISDRISLKAEYLHAGFSKESFSLGGIKSVTTDPSLDLFRLGVNYKFCFNRAKKC